jgi:hypothetical protein
MRRLRTFLRLTASERFLFLGTWQLLWRIRLMLWLLPYQRWRRVVAEMIQIEQEHALNRDMVDQLTRAVRIMRRFVPGASCLTLALTTQILLAREGQRSQLRVGVLQNASGKLEAHAWVQVNGRVVIGGKQGITRFSALPTLELES